MRDFRETANILLWHGPATHFFLCVLASVAFLLVSLTTPLRLPGSKRWPTDIHGSRLFFTFISNEAADDWQKRWNLPQHEIKAELYDQYVKETHNLAERARIKYGHLNEASALFALSLLFLGLSIVLALASPLSPEPPVGLVSTRWSLTLRLAVATVIAVQFCVQIFARLAADMASRQLARDSRSDVRVNRIYRANQSIRWLMITVTIAIFAVVIPGHSNCARLVGGVVAFVAIVLSFAVTAPRRSSRGRAGDVAGRLWGAAVYVVLPLALAGGALLAGGVWQVVGGLVPPVWIALQNLAATYRGDVERRRSAMKTAQVADNKT